MSDDLQRARAKRDALRDELARLDRTPDERAALAQRRADAARALDDADHALARARKRSLPLLDRVYIASPCDVRWDDMKGDARARHCASCDRTVYNLSSMTRRDAEALLAAHGTSICATFYQRTDGTALTADCPVGARRRMRRKLLAASATAVAMSVAGLAAAIGLAPAPAPRDRPPCELTYRGPRVRPVQHTRSAANTNASAMPDYPPAAGGIGYIPERP